MSGVASVEHVQVTTSSGSGSTTISASDTSKCIPFVSKKIVTVGTNEGEIADMAIDVYFTSSPNTVHIVHTGTSGTVTAEIYIVEFDSRVTVESGTFQIAANDDANTATLTTITNTGTKMPFMVFYAKQGALFPSENSSVNIRGRVTGDAELTFDRRTTTGAPQIDGHYYLAQSDSNNDFTVQQVIFTLPDGDATPGTKPSISPVTMNKTFTIASYRSGNTGADDTTDNSDNCPYVYLYDATHLDAVRGAGGDYDCDIAAFVVSFNASGNERVAWRNITNVGNSSPDDIDISSDPVDIDVAIPWTILCTPRNTFTDGVNQFCINDSMVSATIIADGDTLRLEHNPYDSETDVNVAWEVIEWEITSAEPTARRIIVIT